MAGSRTAYRLHLHQSVGESRRARHWFHRLTHSMADTAAPDAAFLEGLEIFARYVRDNGCRVLAPTGRLESEVDGSLPASRIAPPSSPGLLANWSPGCRVHRQPLSRHTRRRKGGEAVAPAMSGGRTDCAFRHRPGRGVVGEALAPESRPGTNSCATVVR